MKRLLGLFFGSLLFISNVFSGEAQIIESIKQLTEKIMPDSTNNNTKASVAILEFKSSFNNQNFEQYIQNILFESFFSTGKYKLIERNNIDKILLEQNFQLSGNVNDESAKSIGHIIGVDYVCYGTILELNDSLKINAKVTNIETGEIISIGNVSVKIDQDLNTLLGNKDQIPIDNKQAESEISNWIVSKQRNDFDGYTSYTFELKSAGRHELIVGYDKWDDKSRSVLKCGILWDGNTRKIDVKDDQGKITTFSTKMVKWSRETGWINNSKSFYFYIDQNTRELFDLFLNNKTLSFRSGENMIKFNTSGLPMIITNSGITYTEMSEAIANEEF